MIIRTFALAGAAFFAAVASASAGQWDADKAVCVDAIAAESGVDAAAYDAKLAKARDGATKRVTVELTANNGAAPIVAECKIKRGEVVSVEIKA